MTTPRVVVYSCSSCISSPAAICIAVLAFCLYHSYSFLNSLLPVQLQPPFVILYVLPPMDRIYYCKWIGHTSFFVLLLLKITSTLLLLLLTAVHFRDFKNLFFTTLTGSKSKNEGASSTFLQCTLPPYNEHNV